MVTEPIQRANNLTAGDIGLTFRITASLDYPVNS